MARVAQAYNPNTGSRQVWGQYGLYYQGLGYPGLHGGNCLKQTDEGQFYATYILL